MRLQLHSSRIGCRATLLGILLLVGLCLIPNQSRAQKPLRLQQGREAIPEKSPRLEQALAEYNAPPVEASNRPYQIRRGDELNIKVLADERLSQAYIVGPDGRITLDFIGSIEAAGVTREQLAERIAARLAEIYRTPLVSVAVTKYTPLRAYVLGQVMQPGPVEFINESSLLRVLSLAGGVARENAPGQGYSSHPFAPPEIAYVLRNPDTIINVDLRELLSHGNRAYDIPVQDDDLIFVPLGKHRQVFVMGEVVRPTVLPLKVDDLSVLQALAEAGGLTPLASQTNITVIRRTGPQDKQPQVFTLNLKELKRTGDLSQDIKLRDQDVVVVPRSKSSYLKFLTQNGPFALLSLVLSLSGR